MLVADFPLEVALSYIFSRVEFAHNMTLYCGIVKLHRAEPSMARAAVDTQHMTRQQFRDKFQAIYGAPISEPTTRLIKSAEAVRDKVMHGKTTTEKVRRGAIDHVLEYANRLNAEVLKLGGPMPFGDLRGFKGRGEALDSSTTRWVLKGMGFPVS